MTNRFFALILGTLLTLPAFGSVVAIVDSGTDYLHKDLANKMWNNPVDIRDNNRDEDLNGYLDDFFGWNFAESNNKVIDYAYLGTLNADITKFFQIQTRMLKGLATPNDLQWVEDKRTEPEFIKKLQVYGNFMHGTHVAGIAAKGADDAEILAVKLIPTEVKLPFSVKSYKNGFGQILVKMLLSQLAKQQMAMLIEVSTYVGSMKADVANGSFGTGFNQAKAIVEGLAGMLGNPTEEEIKELTIYFLNEVVKEGQAMIRASEDTLWVFAAGNDGTNNDELPTSPANVKAHNSIAVAATIDFASLASFSNYGEDMVEVAAPGVGIHSAVPGSQYLEVSGTSQAAPYVANIAARVKDMNPGLLPKQIKTIIMETVDVKSWLKGKVKTSGLVNAERAVRAAELTTQMRIGDAIAQAKAEIQAPKQVKSIMRPVQGNPMVMPLPSMFR
jgi:cell wall-associated protease